MHPSSNEEQLRRREKANIRLALLLGAVVLLALFSTFYFWPSPQLPS